MRKHDFFISILVMFVFSFILFNACQNKKKVENTDSIFYFENSKYDLHTPLIQMKLNGKVQFWIVDTGANMSLLDEKFYSEHQDDVTFLRSVDMNLHGVSGSTTYTSSYVLGYLGKDGYFAQQFLTSDLTSVRRSVKSSTGYDVAGILGADYLERYAFTVDFYNRSVYQHEAPIDSILKIKVIEETGK